ncbi:MAG: hypothetical protein WAV28_19555 [Sedimentisphaerales bacterium]
MEIAENQRAEQRLHYRWPIRFATGVKKKTSPGQIFDVSSKGLAILCHADKNCPHPDQLVTVDFGVPHFDSADSFDPVFFNRIGRVCRVDNLSSKVNRVALQFAEPLFFKPGEQNISESDVQQRLQTKVRSITKADEKAKFYSNALVRAEQETISYVQAKAKAEEKLKAETEARCKTEANLIAQAEQSAEAEARAKFEAGLRAKAEKKVEVQARKIANLEDQMRQKIKFYTEQIENIRTELEQKAKAEAKAKAQVMLRAKAEKKAKAEAQKRANLEAQMQEKIKSYASQIDQIKAEAAESIARAKAQAADTVAKVKAKFKQKAKAYAEAKIGAEKKANAKAGKKDKDIKPTTATLLKKVDKFITDRNRIY